MTPHDPHDAIVAGAPTRPPRPVRGRRARRALVAVVALGSLAGGLGCLAVGVSGADSAVGAAKTSQAPYTRRTVTVPLPGNNGSRRVLVYTNTTTDSAQIPVVYLLHGLPGRPEDFESAGLLGALDHYAAAGGRPLVVAAPDGKGAKHYDTEWADSADRRDLQETFVLQRVIPAVEGANVRDAAHRAIAGFSMGGYGATNIALRHPTSFGQLISIAGYYHVDDPSGVFAGRPAEIAANSPDRHAGSARHLRVLLTDGVEENEPLIQGEVDRFARLLRRHHVAVAVVETPGRHDLGYLRHQLPTILSFLARGWPAV